MLEKRYQVFTKEGKKWSEWFDCLNERPVKWQLKGKLLNEYRVAEIVNGEKVVARLIGTPKE